MRDFFKILKELKDYEDYLAVIVFFIFVFLIYFKSLATPFVFDDIHMILRNSYIKELKNLHLPFIRGRVTNVPLEKGMYRPLLMASFAFNYLFGRLNPIGYHIINMMFHFLNASLLFLLFKQLLKKGSFWPAFIASLLFLLHPVNSEAVIYISCRSTLMASFFLLLGLLSYAKWEGQKFDKKYYLSLISFACGLFTKEVMIIFPLMLMSYDFLFRKDSKRTFTAFIKSHFLFLFIAISYLLLRHNLIGAFTNLSLKRSIYENFLTNLHAGVYYFKLFFYPVNLCIGRYFPTSKSFFEPQILQSAGIVVTLAVIAMAVSIRYPVVTFGIFWFFLNLVPKFIASLALLAAEHHLYLPAMGIVMVIAFVLKKINEVLQERKYKLIKMMVVILILSLLSISAILSYQRNVVWNDETALWLNNIKHSPLAWGAYNNLGLLALGKGRYEEAHQYFIKALAGLERLASPGMEIDLHTNLGRLYLETGKLDLAQEEFFKVLALNPFVAEAHNNLGLVYARKGLQEKEKEEFKLAMELDPSLVEAYSNLAISYFRAKDYQQAIELSNKAIKLNPDYSKPYLVLSKIYEELKDFNQSIIFKKMAMNLMPTDAQDYYELGLLYGKIDNTKAIEAFKEAIKLNPEFAGAHNNLAVIYANLEPPQLELARKHAQFALKYGYKVKPQVLRQLGIEP
ncbi:MAG: tetratricopeptide repeat protein [Candidatus Omnitrophota bacterium]